MTCNPPFIDFWRNKPAAMCACMGAHASAPRLGQLVPLGLQGPRVLQQQVHSVQVSLPASACKASLLHIIFAEEESRSHLDQAGAGGASQGAGALRQGDQGANCCSGPECEDVQGALEPLLHAIAQRWSSIMHVRLRPASCGLLLQV
jgi:hypothetical protein